MVLCLQHPHCSTPYGGTHLRPALALDDLPDNPPVTSARPSSSTAAPLLLSGTGLWNPDPALWRIPASSESPWGFL